MLLYADMVLNITWRILKIFHHILLEMRSYLFTKFAFVFLIAEYVRKVFNYNK